MVWSEWAPDEYLSNRGDGLESSENGPWHDEIHLRGRDSTRMVSVWHQRDGRWYTGCGVRSGYGEQWRNTGDFGPFPTKEAAKAFAEKHRQSSFYFSGRAKFGKRLDHFTVERMIHERWAMEREAYLRRE